MNHMHGIYKDSIGFEDSVPQLSEATDGFYHQPYDDWLSCTC